jgi:hypothetical protein
MIGSHVPQRRHWYDGQELKLTPPRPVTPKPPKADILSASLPLEELSRRTLDTLRADLKYLAARAHTDRHFKAEAAMHRAIIAVDAADGEGSGATRARPAALVAAKDLARRLENPVTIAAASLDAALPLKQRMTLLPPDPMTVDLRFLTHPTIAMLMGDLIAANAGRRDGEHRALIDQLGAHTASRKATAIRLGTLW